MVKSKTFTALLPLFLFSRYLGVLPFSVNKSDTKVIIKTNFPGVLLKLTILNVWFFYIGLPNVLNSHAWIGYGKIQNYLAVWLVNVTLGLANALIILTLVKAKTLAKALNQLVQVEEDMQRYNINIDETKLKQTVLTIIITFTSRTTIFMFVVFREQFHGTTYAQYIELIPWYFCMYFATLVTSLYITPMAIVKNLLETLSKADTNGFPLRNIKKIHAKLLSAAQLFHTCFQLHVLLRIGVLFYALNFSSFYLYKTIANESGSNTATVRLHAIAFDFIEVCALSHMGSSTSRAVSLNATQETT